MVQDAKELVLPMLIKWQIRGTTSLDCFSLIWLLDSLVGWFVLQHGNDKTAYKIHSNKNQKETNPKTKFNRYIILAMN